MSNATRQRLTAQFQNFAVNYLHTKLGLQKAHARNLVEQRMAVAFEYHSVCLRLGRGSDDYDGHGDPGVSFIIGQLPVKRDVTSLQMWIQQESLRLHFKSFSSAVSESTRFAFTVSKLRLSKI